MKRSTTPSFIQNFEIMESLDSGFREILASQNAGKRLHNALLGQKLGAVKAAKKIDAWKNARKLPQGSRERAQAFSLICESYGLTESQTEKDATGLKNRCEDIKRSIGAHVCQKIASRVWIAVEKLLHGKSKRVRFKKKRDAYSIEGKNNDTGLRLLGAEDGTPYFLFRNKRYALKCDLTNAYHKHALDHRVKFVRLLKRHINCKDTYFVQVLFEGLPFRDVAKEERHKKRTLERFGQDYFTKLEEIDDAVRAVVCIDMGPRHIAISNCLVSWERNIALELKNHSDWLKKAQRLQDRSKRASNPKNYDAQGRPLRGKKWVFSKNYLKRQRQIQNYYRKKQEYRKSIHGFLVHEVLTHGNIIKLEKVSYKSFQRNFGKSVGDHGPASLIDKLTRRAIMAGGRTEKINTFQTKLSQTCLCGNQKKKSLSQRVHNCELCGFVSPRDTVSAFLGIFTHNSEVEVHNKKTRVESELNLEEARKWISGHRTLSEAWSKTKTQSV